MSELPADPFGPLADGMTGLHVLYLSIVDSGFSEDHAIRLLQAIMHATIMRGTS